MKISCVGIVHYPDGVVLVRDNEKQKWRLPERMLDETEDVVLCARRCVLTQTGYRTVRLRLFKIQTQGRSAKRGPFIRFIFGCEIGTEPIQTPENIASCFTPEAVLKLAAKDECDDPTLLKLIHQYKNVITAPDEPGESVPFS